MIMQKIPSNVVNARSCVYNISDVSNINIMFWLFILSDVDQDYIRPIIE